MARSTSGPSKKRADDAASSSTEDAETTTSSTSSSTEKRSSGKGRKSTNASSAKDSSDASSKGKAGTSKSDASKANKGPGFFGSIGLFFQQVIGELRKVHTPTRRELVNYTLVVLGFVIIMMLLVTVLDLLFGWGASWVFGTGDEVTWPDFSQFFGGTPAPTAPAPGAPAPVAPTP